LIKINIRAPREIAVGQKKATGKSCSSNDSHALVIQFLKADQGLPLGRKREVVVMALRTRDKGIGEPTPV
jgi:hypothetical protein